MTGQGGRDCLQRGMGELFWMMELFCNLTVVVVMLGRVDSKPRQGGGGRHVSPTNSAVLSLVQ